MFGQSSEIQAGRRNSQVGNFNEVNAKENKMDEVKKIGKKSRSNCKNCKFCSKKNYEMEICQQKAKVGEVNGIISKELKTDKLVGEEKQI